MKIRSLGAILTVSLLCFTTKAQAKEIELQVGIVQRFGDEVTDELTISSTQGDRLTITFLDSEGQPQILQTDQVDLQIRPQPHTQPQLEEQLVLGDFATFETAEDSARQWRSRGIEVEITQPSRWQVWAKRSVYSTPLLRRWLQQSLAQSGFEEPFLQTEVAVSGPIVTFEVEGEIYQQQQLIISSQKSRLLLAEGEEAQPMLFGGSFKLQPNAYGDYTLVNLVDLETYLRGVVPYEIGASAPQTAQQAQTIIARTYALRNLRRFAADNYQLCATVHCQVYKGLSGATESSDWAISSTRGQVLTYQQELVDALYSSTTGGITAGFEDIWNGDRRPYLQPRVDSSLGEIWNLSVESLADEQNFRRFIGLTEGFNEADITKHFRWQRSSTLEELSEDLRKYLKKTQHPLQNFEMIESMEITARSPSGRILEMVVYTDVGTVKLHKTEVRSALGPPRSTLFYLEPMEDETGSLTGYEFIGGGFGHGVGMSQYGSYNLARLGWSAQQILEFYFPGAEIQLLDDSIVFWQEPSSLSNR